MKTTTPRALLAGALAVGTVVLLIACGGGAGSDGPPADALVSGTDVPTSATTSVDGARAFVASVAASSGDSTEPITVGGAVLASSDSTEPAEL